MEELINKKIIEIVKNIIDKPVEQISYNDYSILNSELMKYEIERNKKKIEIEQDKRNKQMFESMVKTLEASLDSPATSANIPPIYSVPPAMGVI